MAVLSAVTPLLAESPKLQRYQSEVANDLSGVKLQDVETQGFTLLRLFTLLASVDRDSELLPVNRAMFLVQAIQGWLLTEDEDTDIPEEVHVVLLQLFTALVVTVEGVSGAHWETWTDLAESVIEVSPLSPGNWLPR